MRAKQTILMVAVLVAASVAVGENAAAETREYWIKAENVLWDYAPSYPINLMTGQPFTEDQEVFVGEFIGRKYLKSMYVEYGKSFRYRKKQPEHLGNIGPVIRAEVGDTIVVHFCNESSFPASMHPHGVFYDKASEGAPYADGTGPKKKGDDIVETGSCYDYVWGVPERAGPGPADGSSVAWVYHSHVDEPADTNAGLMGAMVITAKGKAREDGSPKDVDREFVSLFSVWDENSSRWIDENIARAGLTGSPVLDTEEFEESNLMHGINGRVYGNDTGYDMDVGEKVRWYIIGMGTEVDLHTPHWHGVTLLHHGVRLDVAEVLPAASKAFDLTADNPGTWMFHCHVNDHIEAGMMTKFTIHDRKRRDDDRYRRRR